MIRTATQILMGLMLFFATLTLAPRMALHFRTGNTVRALYLLLLCLVSLFFALAAFFYAST